MEDRDKLIQEEYIDTEYGPWKVLVICQCLNQATWVVVERIVNELFRIFPNPQAMREADPMEVFEIVRDLGFGARRTDFLISMSKSYRDQFEEYGQDFEKYDIWNMEGCGVYAMDAWNLFVLKKRVEPKDKHLKRYKERMEIRYE